jgi:hypothetical protein
MSATIRRIVLTPAALFWLTACSDGALDPATECGDGTPVEEGAVIEGTLGPGDELDVDGAYMDAYLLTVPSARTYRILMSSSELDSYLWVQAGYGAVYADDDSGGGENGFDAQVVRTLVASCYRISATTFDVGATGAYTLSVDGF